MERNRRFDDGTNAVKTIGILSVIVIVDILFYYKTELYSYHPFHYVNWIICFSSIVYLLGNFSKIEGMSMIKVPGVYVITILLLIINIISFASFYQETGLNFHNAVTRDKGTMLYYSLGNFINRSDALEAPIEIRNYALAQTFLGYITLAYLISRFIDLSVDKHQNSKLAN